MAVFILVHGGWHSGWCWERVTPLLELAGHRGLAPDLPGHGADRTPLSARPWERYAPAIAELAATQPEPVILVGHSSGGMIISDVARRAPESVAALVYLAAFLLPAGATPRDAMGDGNGSLLIDALVVDPVAGVTTIRPEMARDVFYHDCSNADVAWALARLQPEPLIRPGSADAADVAEAGESQVPRVYIETLQDRALPLAIQRRMQANLPCEAVHTLDASHSPFLSQPRKLAAILASIAGGISPSRSSSEVVSREPEVRRRVGKEK